MVRGGVCRVGQRSGGICGDDWHRACGLEKQKQGEKKAERVAVIPTRRPCMMAMPSEGCVGAMALSTAGSVNMSISSQQSSATQHVRLQEAG
eukprot:3773061-Pleurochrysis_carterae.AAC.1